MSLKKDILINPDEIDYEILRQAELMRNYLEIMDDAKNVLDRSLEELDTLMVGLDKKIRAKPEEYDLTKITETVVAAAIKDTTQYQAMREVVLDNQHEFNNSKSAVRSIEVKKSSLEHLVKLHGQSYFAGPSVPRDLSAEVKKKQESSNSKVKFKRKNKKG